MKQKSRLSIWLLLLLIIACSKNGDPAPTLTGTWKLETTQVTGCTGTSADFNYPETACNVAVPLSGGGGTLTIPCVTLVITASTISASGGGTNTTDSYTTSGNTITFGGVTATFVVTATTLTLTNAYDPGCQNILKFSRQ